VRLSVPHERGNMPIQHGTIAYCTEKSSWIPGPQFIFDDARGNEEFCNLFWAEMPVVQSITRRSTN
jgi:hypothetical protein